MNGIVVTTDLEIRTEEFGDPLYKTVGAAVGGSIEHVRPARLRHPYCMFINADGQLRGLPLNQIGSYLYGMDFYGKPIVGNIVIMKDGYRDGKPDIVGLDDADVEKVKFSICILISMLHLQPKGEHT